MKGHPAMVVEEVEDSMICFEAQSQVGEITVWPPDLKVSLAETSTEGLDVGHQFLDGRVPFES
ncbi:MULTISPECIES: hypothetical protein [unclassified Streptomyces]|uniref:hypothetical protein n=1 Tax=unclassified Streptomyces TaxID=2593676 RepID=UPI0024730DA8|nr:MULTISPECIES: hypothetical protein [unclassified Streptomyces]